MGEEAPWPELSSPPRISFSHDLLAPPPPAAPSRQSDTSLLPEPEFDFANETAADVAPADRLFAGGVLLPMPPLPPAPKPGTCRQLPTSSSSCHLKPPACQQQQRAAGSWAPTLFSRSSSVNSATTTRGAPRSSGRFGCPSFPLLRSRSAGSAAAVLARDDGFGGSVVTSNGGGGGRRRPQHKKFAAAAAAAASNGSSSRVYYYGGSSNKKGVTSSHGVRVSPVINVPFIGTSLANVLSYLLCDCSSSKTTKCQEF